MATLAMVLGLVLLQLCGMAVSAPVKLIGKNTTAAADCLDILSSSKPFSGVCTAAWVDLRDVIRPTQKQVGYAWVQYKLDKDFTSAKNAQKEMDSSLVPAVLGGSGHLYITDDHHGLAALDYSGYSDTVVTVDVLCDLRSLGEEEFWSTLASQNLVYLAAHPEGEPNALPAPIQPSDLPSSFRFRGSASSFTLSDDPWRAIVGYSRKVQTAAPPAPACDGDADYKYCERCMYRGCDDGSQATGPSVDYFEFRWAYFLNDATLYSPSWWPSSKEHAEFKAEYEHLPQPSVVGSIDTSAWMTTAEHVIALCRAPSTASYPVPKIYPGDGRLPGFINGYEKLDADPDCDPPTCVVGDLPLKAW